MKEIKHLFFDLDHTLWDYDRSAQETLLEIYENLDMKAKGIREKKFVNTFYDVNEKLWHKYNHGLVDREHIKNDRFKDILKKVGIDIAYSQEASEYFISNCSTKPYLMPDALEALQYLEGKYEMHIITNGFDVSQELKMQSSGIRKFFDVIVTSETANTRKPYPEIFELSLELAKANKSNSIMIGDNPKTDIQGAHEFGMQTVFYNPSGRKKSIATYTIESLTELIQLF
ncbi:MAG: YjjG family noncanonical pyrimidine nucleotidase [Ekhidna sp.]